MIEPQISTMIIINVDELISTQLHEFFQLQSTSKLPS